MHRNDLKVLGFNQKMQSCWDCINKLGFASSLYNEWVMFLCDSALHTCQDLKEDEQDRLFLGIRDYCQQHQINLKGEDLSFVYTKHVYRFLPKFGSLGNKRRKLKRGYRLYCKMREILALIEVAELKKKKKVRNGE